MLVFKTALAGGVLLFSSSFLAACSSASHTGESSSGGGGAGGSSSSSSESSTSGSTGSTGSTGSSSGTFMSASYPAAPQVVNASNGPVLTAPKLQMIAYASDTTIVPGVEAMAAEFAAMPSWADQTAEYGVGPLTVLPTISLTSPLTALDDNGNPSAFQQYLASQISGANPAWGAADASTIYMFILPEGTSVDSNGPCCSSYLGYHGEAAVPNAAAGNISVPYAVVCDCGVEKGFPLTALQWVTTTVSHEAVEAATDPYFNTAPAFAQEDNPHAIWTVASGGEIADMCEFNSDSNYIPPGSKYMIQRSWSNKAALAGENPCVPAPTEPYFNSYPVLPDSVTLMYYNQPWTTKGVTVPLNQSVTIDVVLSSSAETSGPWTVKAYDMNDYVSGATPNTQVSLDKSTGSNGDVLKLTIKAVAAPTAAEGGVAGFVLVSTLGDAQNITMGAIVN